MLSTEKSDHFIPHSQADIDKIQVPDRSIDEWLAIFYDIVSAQGIKLIAIYGTCLGFVRDKGIIEGDTDADLGIYLDDLGRLHQCIDALLENGIYISNVGHFQIGFRFPKHDFYIDIWPIQKVKNPFLKLWGIKWLCDHVYYKKDFFRDPKPVTFHDRHYYMPNPTEAYLEDTYGPNWRIPIKDSPAGPRGFLSQCLNDLFVDFSVPLQFSGDNRLGTYKPWVSKILKRYFPNAKITQLFKHPE